MQTNQIRINAKRHAWWVCFILVLCNSVRIVINFPFISNDFVKSASQQQIIHPLQQICIWSACVKLIVIIYKLKMKQTKKNWLHVHWNYANWRSHLIDQSTTSNIILWMRSHAIQFDIWKVKINFNSLIYPNRLDFIDFNSIWNYLLILGFNVVWAMRCSREHRFDRIRESDHCFYY